MMTDEGEEVNALPDDCWAVLAESLAKAFMVVIERDWYDCWAPLDGR